MATRGGIPVGTLTANEGRLIDTQGRKCDFRKSVIILTCNLESGLAKKRGMGLGTGRKILRKLIESSTNI